jgi:hypothetical protein
MTKQIFGDLNFQAATSQSSGIYEFSNNQMVKSEIFI